jgi:ATP-dependent RNA helicase DDX56/DBP9
MRAVTRQGVKEARLKEIKQELLRSKKLAEHFDANPRDLEALRHDKPVSSVRRQPHLAIVPKYLRPDSEGATGAVSAVASSRKLRGIGKKSLFKKRRRSDPRKSGKAGRGGGKGGRGGKGGGRGSKGGRGGPGNSGRQ